MTREIFLVKNNISSDIELKDFGIIIPSGVTVELANYDEAVLSDELYQRLNDGDLIRIVNTLPIISINDAFTINPSLNSLYFYDKTQINSGVTSLSTAISTNTSTDTSEHSSLSTSVSNEISVRNSADSSLSTAVSSEKSTRTSNDLSLSTAVSSEVSTRGSADLSLSTAISMVSGATPDFSSLSTAVSSEASTRGSADTSLSTAISSISGNTSLSTAVSSEASTRGSADTSLSTATSTNLSSITTLSTAVSNEISSRTSGDASLTTLISNEISARTSESLLYLKLSGGTMNGPIDMNGNQVIVNVAPIDQYHLTNKAYVDAIAQGVAVHAPVHVVSTTPITLSGTQIIDGYQLNEGNFVLVNGQSGSTPNVTNGIYVVHSASTWSRRTDADGLPDNEIELGDFVFVQTGNTNAATGWVLGQTSSTGSTIKPSTDTQLWFKMASPIVYTTDGEGIELNGTIFSLELNGSTLTKDASGLKLNDSLYSTITGNTSNILSLSTSISNEISSRTSGDASLTTLISNEISSRTSGDASLTTLISNEISTRSSADSSLTTLISNEISSRTSGDASLTTLISNEISTRSSADSSLSTAISNIPLSNGTSFPVTPTDGYLYYRTDAELLFYFDSGRTKWLSVAKESFTAGRTSAIAGTTTYLRVGDATQSSTSGFNMVRNGTILGVTVKNSNTLTSPRDIQVRVNNSIVNMVSITIPSADSAASTSSANLDFSANDIIQIVALAGATGSALNNVIVSFEVSYRI